MIDSLDTLITILEQDPKILSSSNFIGVGEMSCCAEGCGENRKMDIECIHSPYLRNKHAGLGIHIKKGILHLIVPSLFRYICKQCDTEYTAVVYQSPDGPSLVVLPSCHGGFVTHHTPDSVKYYLDQAYKAHLINANSAAMAMFRGALEHLLFEQGYAKGMLDQKIKELEKDITSVTAPKWAMELETDYLKVLKELGNGAIHPNNGDIKKQEAIDTVLINEVKEVFQQLLTLVYEIAVSKGKRLSHLKTKASILKK